MIKESFFSFVFSQWPSLVQKTWEQLYLVSIASALSASLGLSLALLAHYYKPCKNFILSTSNIIQTIPSLALLAFLLPFFGIGAQSAIIAMSLYGLLPVVRASLSGIESIPPSLLEAASALGLTRRQSLFSIELPLALPQIISGIKTSTVLNVGIATLAALIGAGGLGDFIMRGLAVNNMRLILMGAIPAALLALFLDAAINAVAHYFDQRQRGSYAPKNRRFFYLLVSLGVLFMGMAVFRGVSSWGAKPASVTVASKNFTESMILAEMMAIMIEQHSYLTVQRKLNLGSTVICQQALMDKKIDLYPEYTGTAYIIVLGQNYRPGLNRDDLYQWVKKQYQQRFNLTWLAPFGFNNSEGMAVRLQSAQEYSLNTISDLKKVDSFFIFAAPSENLQRSDGIPGLKEKYGLQLNHLREMDMSLMYDALSQGQVDGSVIFTSDGRIPKYHLKVLADDRHFFPPYYAAPLIRTEILKQHPELNQVLAPLANVLDEQTMQNLNAEVDIDQQTPHEVAEHFLQEKKLIPAQP